MDCGQFFFNYEMLKYVMLVKKENCDVNILFKSHKNFKRLRKLFSFFILS